MKLNDKRIDVYPSIWRVIGLTLISLLFVVGGFFMTNYPRVGVDKYIGYIGMAFFSFGVIVGIGWLILIAMHKPLARIFDDRLEYLIPARMKYEIIPFLHVEMFVITKTRSAKIIRADYLTGGRKNTGIVNTLVSVGKVCDILNDKLERYWEQPMLSQELDQASVTQYLKSMGIESWRFGFGTTGKTDRVVVMRDGDTYELVYINDKGAAKTLSNHLTENNACHALLEHFIEKEAFKSKYGVNNGNFIWN